MVSLTFCMGRPGCDTNGILNSSTQNFLQQLKLQTMPPMAWLAQQQGSQDLGSGKECFSFGLCGSLLSHIKELATVFGFGVKSDVVKHLLAPLLLGGIVPLIK